MIIRMTDSPLRSDLVGESLPDFFGLTTVETSVLFQLQVFDFSGSPAHRDVSNPATRQSLTHSRLCSLLHVSRNLCLLMKQVPSASQEGLYIFHISSVFSTAHPQGLGRHVGLHERSRPSRTGTHGPDRDSKRAGCGCQMLTSDLVVLCSGMS